MTTGLAVRPAIRLAPAPLTRPVTEILGATGPVAGQALLDLDFEVDDPLALGPQRGRSPDAVVPGIVQGVLEVLDGRRSPVVLQRAVAPDVLARLARRAARRRDEAGRRPPRILRLRLATPRSQVCECAAVVVIGGRVRALALRLRRVSDRWVVDALDIG